MKSNWPAVTKFGGISIRNSVGSCIWFEDDGCRTGSDGYTDCDDSYVQIIERVANKAEDTKLRYNGM